MVASRQVSVHVVAIHADHPSHGLSDGLSDLSIQISWLVEENVSRDLPWKSKVKEEGVKGCGTGHRRRAMESWRTDGIVHVYEMAEWKRRKVCEELDALAAASRINSTCLSIAICSPTN